MAPEDSLLWVLAPLLAVRGKDQPESLGIQFIFAASSAVNEFNGEVFEAL
jgi:hypothetical protein